ncbi:L-fuculose-phosphate aldolase [Enterococcus xiangfangensis]|uniref:L-fuculose-phosphate aldolase n=1 Tax=Enterococcus xiangfangensis TaxID=1296537 RepID=A0ABU3FDI6_9ENTE|nr:L-fuculose-phosphate aldolase [Enterococcus xiangfangensis]MBM7712025.1 L-fuculose-phosphate aldolase [Enterococcus xiangfangensis]MDT2760087.1 L-fuculose-phosphate aldolase [Enterococcus xiangfangensis]NBK08011.1 L-fuculose-phosphate aldolase [Enterococcus asini]
MKYQKERELIVEYGKKLITENLTTGTGGNISLYLPEEQVMLISPSGVPYFETKPEDIVLMDLQGNVLEGTRKPSSEYELHSIFYANRPEVHSVVHTHSEYATTFACLQQAIEPLHYIIGSVGEKVRCCAYKTFGTYELAEEAFNFIHEDNGILLGNHGVLTIGPDLPSAFSVAKDIEFLAKLDYRARCIGTPKLLNQTQMQEVLEKFATYGQQ